MIKMVKMTNLRIIGLAVVVVIIIFAIVYIGNEPSDDKTVNLISGKDVCNQLIDKAEKDKCLNNYEHEELNVSLQSVKAEYATASIDDMKLLSEALRNKDLSLCAGIVDSYTKSKCVNS